MTGVATDLELLGDALQGAWRADHGASGAVRRRPRARRAWILLAALLILITAGAALAGVLKSTGDEEQGLLDAYRMFAGTNPHCEQRSPTAFHCVLATPPTEITFGYAGHPLRDAYLGLKSETVDSDKRVDGGCVSVRSDGRAWDCFLGEEAVERGVVRRERLGAFVPVPPTA